jgi:hypothetical protein
LTNVCRTPEAKAAKAAKAKTKALAEKTKASAETLKKTKAELSELKDKFRTNGGAFGVSSTRWSPPPNSTRTYFVSGF